MIYLTIITAVAVLALPLLRWVDARDRQATEEARAVERAEWTQERQELLSRIQHPHIPVMPKPKGRAERAEEASDAQELARVGTVRYDPSLMDDTDA
jgi:hypothetical protein